MNSLVLIGHRGVGKTTLGRELATVLERPFFDSDEQIAWLQGVSGPAELVRLVGWERFRQLEASWIQEALSAAHCNRILALGAGAIEHRATRRRLLESTTVALWLPKIVQAQRWATKGLPIGLGPQISPSAGPASALLWDQRVVQRAEAYQQCATHHLQLTGELQTDLQLLVAFAREQGIMKEEPRAF